MVAEDGFSNRQSRRGTTRSLRHVGGWAGILLALGLLASAALPVSAGAAKDGGHQVAGGGKTIIEGGGPGLVPVTTVLAFHANALGGAFAHPIFTLERKGIMTERALRISRRDALKWGALAAAAPVLGGLPLDVFALGDSVVLLWNEAALQSVRDSRLGPPMVARALAIIHTCIFDAWAAYDHRALG